MKWLSFLLTASTTMSAPLTLGDQPLEVKVTNAPIVATVAHAGRTLVWFPQQNAEDTVLEKEAAKQAHLLENRVKMAAMIKDLRTHVGKTWYVFSGTTPQGWDCSGLVLWAYEQLGIQLEHRASLQGKAGKLVDAPTPGDIVVFTYNGNKSAYHTGIYIGDGLFIHAPRKGEVTRIESVEQFAGKYSTVTYRNLLDN